MNESRERGLAGGEAQEEGWVAREQSVCVSMGGVERVGVMSHGAGFGNPFRSRVGRDLELEVCVCVCVCVWLCVRVKKRENVCVCVCAACVCVVLWLWLSL